MSQMGGDKGPSGRQAGLVGSNAEVLRSIGEILRDREELTSLASLAQTDHLFNEIFMPLLYRKLVFNKPKSFLLFRRAFFGRKSSRALAKCYEKLLEGDFELDVGKYGVKERSTKRRCIGLSTAQPTLPAENPLIPSTIRAFKICRYVEILKLSHAVLQCEARDLGTAGSACAKNDSVLFASLRKIVIDGNIEASKDREAFHRDFKLTEIPLYKALRFTCQPTYLCVDQVIASRQEVARRPYRYHYRERPFWYSLSEALPSLKTVIVHKFVEEQMFVSREAVHRLCSSQYRSRSDIFNAIRTPTESLAGSLVFALSDPDSKATIELSDESGEYCDFAQTVISHILGRTGKECLAGEDVPQEEIPKILQGVAERVRFVPEEDAQPPCEACGE